MIQLKRMLFYISFVICFCTACEQTEKDVFVEVESFSDKGGWVVDQQFMDLMGSSYLMAHGMGVPVKDASTILHFPRTGKYRLYVRTYNWTSPWSKKPGPGGFQIRIEGKTADKTFGTIGDTWIWQDGGEVEISNKRSKITLHDLTGLNGRCDAILFTQKNSISLPADLKGLTKFRYKQTGIKPKSAREYDFVVVGGGIAGICASVSAARLGLKVALIHDRPIVGGNNSSEVRVHLGGRIGMEPYPALGGIVKELSPTRGGNAKPADYYEDWKKASLLDNEPNITQYLNYRAFSVEKSKSKINSITAKHIESGEELIFHAPIFADCTGDGTIGVLAGSEYMTGRESKACFGEETAPETGDKMTMGTSVQWYSKEEDYPTRFPLFEYGVPFNEESIQKVAMGEWTWETGMHQDQINDFEQIRDYGLLVIYSNWSFLKNKHANKDKYANKALDWVAYIGGKRESRRLIGDVILKEQDIVNQVEYSDASAATSWSIDLHYPDPKNSQHFEGKEFKSIALHRTIYPYPIPYRCFYSRNVDNLFMAGRNISVTHIALGTIRVMRTTGMMGEVVGMAASICKEKRTNPRGVYENYMGELKALMRKGVGKEGTDNYPDYNLGRTLLKANVPVRPNQ